jgi:hypothetical protein
LPQISYRKLLGTDRVGNTVHSRTLTVFSYCVTFAAGTCLRSRCLETGLV